MLIVIMYFFEKVHLKIFEKTIKRVLDHIRKSNHSNLRIIILLFVFELL